MPDCCAFRRSWHEKFVRNCETNPVGTALITIPLLNGESKGAGQMSPLPALRLYGMLMIWFAALASARVAQPLNVNTPAVPGVCTM